MARSDGLRGRGLLIAAVVAVLLVCGMQRDAGAASRTVNGFFVRGVPSAYAQQERFWSGLKGSGADTVVLELPMDERGLPDLRALPNTVYLVHQAGMRIFILMPTRGLHAVVQERPGWEDWRYDLAAGAYRRTGKLDLFHEQALAYLTGLAKKIAAYSVDGILLDEDFVYRTSEAMGRSVEKVLEQKLGFPVAARDLFLRIDRSDGEPVITEYGKGFSAWARLKRDRLVEAYGAIRTAARSQNPGIVVGVPVPVLLPLANPDGLLREYAFDISAYRAAGVDHFWTLIAHRDLKTRKGLSYRESRQLVARMAKAALDTVNDPERMIVVLQAVSASDRAITLTEIEETTKLVRSAGRSGLVYIITPDEVPSAVLTNKIFRQGE